MDHQTQPAPPAFLPQLPVKALKAFIGRLQWMRHARGDQLTPKGDWRIWLVLAGRGWGKTRTGAEDIAAYALWHEKVRVAVIAPTFADARDVCVEGESGLLRALPPETVTAWHRTTGDIHLYNGSRIKIYSAEQPERLRGPQHHRVWCDELGAWTSREAFDQMWFGLRLGDDPRVVITTTPRNTPLIHELVKRRDQDVHVTTGRTTDNAAHLPAQTLAQLQQRYAGTRLGRQELDAELLEETEGSLWTYAMIERNRVTKLPPLERVIVAIDPALSHGPESDETGIVATGLGADGLLYVLADVSGRFAPDVWVQRALSLYKKWNASLVVAETNAGGELVARLLRQHDPFIPFKPVRALKGKIDRAIPIAALYEQNRVKHVGIFNELEDQMTRFTPDIVAAKSPDRADALIWSLTTQTTTTTSAPRVVSI